MACGGGGSIATSRPSAGGPAASSTPAQPTPLVVEEGDSIEREHVLAAFDALQSLESWTFSGKYWTKGFDQNYEQSVTGTERRTPEVAVFGVHPQSTTGEDFHYIRIGDDIWANAGQRDYFHYDADGAENLIEQYEPFYVAALVDDIAGAGTREFDPVGVETVNGRPAMHYTLSEFDLEKVTEFLHIDPSLFAGDVWIAVDGGHLVAMAWGPQSKDAAGPTMGFRYDVTAINCECPIEAPEES